MDLEKNKLLICTLEPVHIGEEFEQLPSRIEVQDWFAMGPMERPLINALTNDALDLMRPFEIEVGEVDSQSNGHITPVRLLKRIGSLASLHEMTAELIVKFGGQLSPEVPENRTYRPRIAGQNSDSFVNGQRAKLSALHLISKDSQQKQSYKVERTFYFGHKK